ncbi:MAG: hypothetical protein WD794_08535 [Mycobacteriales bacterium]
MKVRGSELHLADGRVVRTTASPISIDVDQFAGLATSDPDFAAWSGRRLIS